MKYDSFRTYMQSSTDTSSPRWSSFSNQDHGGLAICWRLRLQEIRHVAVPIIPNLHTFEQFMLHA